MAWKKELFQGQSIGRCPKDKLFNAYIEMEQQLREFDRCRILYQKFLEFGPENCNTWKKVKYILVHFVFQIQLFILDLSLCKCDGRESNMIQKNGCQVNLY